MIGDGVRGVRGGKLSRVLDSEKTVGFIRSGGKPRDVAELVECLSSMHEGLGSIPRAP